MDESFLFRKAEELDDSLEPRHLLDLLYHLNLLGHRSLFVWVSVQVNVHIKEFSFVDVLGVEVNRSSLSGYELDAYAPELVGLAPIFRPLHIFVALFQRIKLALALNEGIRLFNRHRSFRNRTFLCHKVLKVVLVHREEPVIALWQAGPAHLAHLLLVCEIGNFRMNCLHVKFLEGIGALKH